MTTPESTALSDADLVNSQFQSLPAGERIAWLAEQFPNRIVASTSFGLQAAVILQLIHEFAPQLPVVWLDTGYLFPETYRYAKELMERFPLDYRVYQPKMSPARQEALYGNLWEQGEKGHSHYSILNKVEPMDRALKETATNIWISGVRRAQSSSRKDRPFAEQQQKTLKVYPILDWADAQISSRFYTQKLPTHPLAAKGYQTMGDWHSTSPVVAGLEAETSRFGGEKYECGLHENSNLGDFQI